MSKWLSPSSIHFLSMHSQLIVGDDTDDSPVNELSRKLAAEEMSIKVPKMQVSEKDGKMFALNNSSLQLMRQLEKKGKLHQGLIQVEVVPLSKVPANIQMGMIADINSSVAGHHSSDQFVNSNDYDQHQHQHQHQPDSSHNSQKNKIIQKPNSEIKGKIKRTQEGQGGQSGKEGNEPNINVITDEESDREEDDEEDDEEEADDNEDVGSGSSSQSDMQCNVCDGVFVSATLLAKHQIKKKHFGCSVCDTVFPSLRELEEHKEILDHWSDDDNPLTEEENSGHNTITKPQREELERLL